MRTPLPIAYAQNLLRWAHQNSAYTVYLWTEYALFDHITRKLEEIFPTMAEFQPEAPIAHVPHPQGVTIQFFQKHRSPLCITICYLETLEAHSNPILVYEELDQWQRYGTASDIFRLWVLYQYGGIYFDFDIFPVQQHIPLQIPAPKGILFCEDMHRHGIIVSIVASPKESPAIMSFLRTIDCTDTNSPITTRGIVEITDYDHALYQSIQSYRFRLAHLPSWAESQRRGLKMNLEILLRSSTTRTGTCRVYDWISMLEGTDVDTGYRVSVSHKDTLESLEQFSPDDDEEPRLYDDSITILYSFQRQANYYPTVEIHGSWIR